MALSLGRSPWGGNWGGVCVPRRRAASVGGRPGDGKFLLRATASIDRTAEEACRLLLRVTPSPLVSYIRYRSFYSETAPPRAHASSRLTECLSAVVPS